MSDFQDGIRQAIIDYADEPIMVGNFVVLAEVIDSEGSHAAFVGHNADIPVWRELGLLNMRLEDIRMGGFDMFEVAGDDEA